MSTTTTPAKSLLYVLRGGFVLRFLVLASLENIVEASADDRQLVHVIANDAMIAFAMTLRTLVGFSGPNEGPPSAHESSGALVSACQHMSTR